MKLFVFSMLLFLKVGNYFSPNMAMFDNPLYIFSNHYYVISPFIFSLLEPLENWTAPSNAQFQDRCTVRFSNGIVAHYNFNGIEWEFIDTKFISGKNGISVVDGFYTIGNLNSNGNQQGDFNRNSYNWLGLEFRDNWESLGDANLMSIGSFNTMNSGVLNGGSISIGTAFVYPDYKLNVGGSIWLDNGNKSQFVGNMSGNNNPSLHSVCLGFSTGSGNTSDYTLNLGFLSGLNAFGSKSTHVGYLAGSSSIGADKINIGSYAGFLDSSVAIINIGHFAGYNSQDSLSINFGFTAGENITGTKNINFGEFSGSSSFGSRNLNIGSLAGSNLNSVHDAINIGYYAGRFSNSESINLGLYSGWRSNLSAINIGNFVSYNQGISNSNTIAIGLQANFSGNSISSIAIGQEAGYIMGGQESIGIGRQSLSHNLGSQNIAIGGAALREHEIGDKNSAIGFAANSSLFGTNDSYKNSCCGWRSGYVITNAHSNTFIGESSADRTRDGSNNVTLGSQSLHDNRVGSYNIGIGSKSLYSSNSTHVDQLIVGNEYVVYILGDTDWSFVGATYAVQDSFFIASNIGTGTGVAGSLNLYDSNSNVCIGSNSMYSVGLGRSNIALGYNSGFFNSSNSKLFISNSDTSQPLIGGDFDTKILNVGGNLGFSKQYPLTGSEVVNSTLFQGTDGALYFKNSLGIVTLVAPN